VLSANTYITLSHSHLPTQIFQGQRLPLATGDLLLECLALPTDATANLTSPGGQVVRPNPFSDPPPPHLDLYLILKAGGFELCLVPGIKMKRSPGFSSERLDRDVTFTIPSSNSKDAFVEIVLPKPLNEEDEQDLETLEILFKQYGSLDVPNEFVNRDIPGHGLIDTTATTTTSSTTSTPTTATPTEPSSPAPKFTEGKKPPPPIPPRPGMRHSTSGGRFVLVDESTGQVLGELDQSLQVEEGHRVQGTANPSEPVVVDFGQLESGYATTISVKTVDESDLQSDWILKSAHYLSKGILTLGSTYKSGVTGAAEFYTKNTKPGTEPVKLSRGTKEGIRQVHNVSAKGLKVTRKSLGVVQDVSSRLGGVSFQPLDHLLIVTGFNLDLTDSQAIGGVINKAATAGFQEYDEFKRTNTPPGSNLPSRRSSMVSGSGAGSGSASGQAQGYMDDKSPPSPPSYTAQGNETPPPAKKQKGFWLRVLTAAEVVGTSIEATTANLVESTTSAAATAAG
jgi:spartin